MDRHLIGEICALLTAITWAMAMVLFKRSGEQIKPMALNLFKNVVGLFLLLLTVAFMPDAIAELRQYPIEDFYVLIISGVVGIAIADTIFFRALNTLGVGITSIVDCCYSPLIFLFAALVLSETIESHHYFGAAFILSSVFVTSSITPPAGRTRRQLLSGILLGIFSIALMAVGIVFAKPVLEAEDFPLIPATVLRLGAGTVVLAIMGIASPTRRALWNVFRPCAAWKNSLPASILGAYISLILWIAGFKYTHASIAGLLNQTSVVFALMFAAWILKEQLTPRKMVAVGLAVCGILVVALGGQ